MYLAYADARRNGDYVPCHDAGNRQIRIHVSKELGKKAGASPQTPANINHTTWILLLFGEARAGVLGKVNFSKPFSYWAEILSGATFSGSQKERLKFL